MDDIEEKIEDLREDEGGKKQRKKSRTVLGVLLLVAGIVIIASAIVVPAINRKQNDKDIEEIRNGKYADEVTAPAVSEETAVTGGAVSQTAVEPDGHELKMQQILADNTRIGIVEIEKIDVLYAVVEGTEDEQINRAVGHLKESAGIGQQGNCVIAGHRGGYYGTFFERLPELENGDVIKMTDLNGVDYYYTVYNKEEVHPADWSVIRDLSDLHTLTLITCEDDTRRRIVVQAALFQP